MLSLAKPQFKQLSVIETNLDNHRLLEGSAQSISASSGT
jgi:hypothetical protein